MTSVKRARLAQVSALYVDPKGHYPNIRSVDWWDESRDARNYIGRNPVVAHPPCQLWGPFAVINYKRWGGKHNVPGKDGGCFAHALKVVRVWGGVLEHPASSRAWAKFGIKSPPREGGWLCIGTGPGRRSHWVCEVWQSAYGHRARKRTWLYYCGSVPPLPARWRHPPGTHQCGYHDQRGKKKNKPTLGKREASATPLAFARFLVRIARRSALGKPDKHETP